MFTFAFILNIVVLGIGGILLLVGLLLLGFGIFALLRARRAPVAAPSYSKSVDYPAENGIERGFEDKQQWASEIAAGAGPAGGGSAGAGSAGAGSAGAGIGEAGRDAAGDISDGETSRSEAGSTASNWFKNVKHAREKSFLVVGGLLALIGVYMLLSTIALIA
ncbi:hypothetical protein [Gulosibacter chungangensis]|uniref:hypothetical protein n=1 Tax=Gulosibacter chungangensis TaxID=979746 RepID=UPI00178789FD|nr:hypothetical protein [Gulosibacter chungangensis]